jgi:methionyl-tRNA formyltransferase
MRIILFAEEAAGVRVLRMLSQRQEEVVAVVTSAPGGGGATTNLAKVAETLNYDVIPAGTLGTAELVRLMDDEGVEILLNVHSLNVLPGPVVSAPRIGSFNLHPGQLPQFAGLNAPSWSIYLQAEQHAVTLHWMLEGIDTGPIAFAEYFDLSDQDTGLSVSSKCVTLGVPLIERLLDVAAQSPDRIPRVAQEAGQRKFFKRADIPNDGWIDWKLSARQIVAFVRAADYGPFHSPWGAPRFRQGETLCRLVKASALPHAADRSVGTVLAVDEDAVSVSTGEGIVVLQQLLLDNGIVKASELLREGQILKSKPGHAQRMEESA